MLIIFITESLVPVNSASKVWCTQKLKMEGCSLDEVIAQSMQLMGISSLKTKQQEAIKAFMNGKDVFVSLPTGYGKSLIYLLLPLIFDRVKGKMILS